jgi:hypothetical protein
VASVAITGNTGNTGAACSKLAGDPEEDPQPYIAISTMAARSSTPCERKILDWLMVLILKVVIYN